MIPETTKQVMNIIAKQLFEQNLKGMNKYGESIDEAEYAEDGVPYDWNRMVIEELIDGMQYLVKENMRLKKRK